MKQDYNGVRTAQDLERKYDFTNLEKVNEINNNIIQANKTMLTSNMNTELKLFVEAVTKYMEDYSVDGNITTYYFSGIPSLNNLPTSEWITDEEKNNHIWDLYYNKETGYVYMFTYDDGTYQWERLEDYDVEKALALANAARDTKDNQRRLFLVQPTPPYESGDMWKNGDEILICQIGKPSGETYAERDFIIDSKYVDNTVATEANNKLTVLSGSVLEIENGVDRYSRTLNQTIKVVDEHGNYIGDRAGKTTTITQDLDGFNLSIGAWDSSKGSLSQLTAQLRADVNEIRGEIGDITDVTITKDGIGVVYFNEDDESINESQPINMSIYPTTEDLSRLYPSTNLFPSTTMYPIELSIDFYNQTEDEHIYYPFPKNLRILGTTYDEFVYDYENEECKVIRRIGIDASGNKYILQTPTEEEIEFPEIHLTAGKYVVTFIPFNTAYMKIRLMSQNMYTSQFATRVEMNGRFEYTSDHFTTELSKKVGNDEVISRINQTAEQITIAANKVNISGVITAINNNTTTTIDGNKITTGTITASQIAANTITATEIKTDAITSDKIAAGAVTADEISSGAITAVKIATGAITAEKINTGAITADKIAAGAVTAAKVSSDIITTTNFSAQTINANNITAGTLSAASISLKNVSFTPNISSIAGWNIRDTYLSGSSAYDVAIYKDGRASFGNDYGWINTGSASTWIQGNSYSYPCYILDSYSHPNKTTDYNNRVSIRLHAATGKIYASNNTTYGSTNSTGGNSLDHSDIELAANNGSTRIYSAVNTWARAGNYNIVEGGRSTYSGVILTSGVINVGRDSGTFGFSAASRIDIGAASTTVNIKGNAYRNDSSRNLKTKIKLLSKTEKEEIYNAYKNQNTYTYYYKKSYGDEHKKRYGFILDEMEDTILKETLDIQNLDDKGTKNYNPLDLSRTNFIVIKLLQDKIETLQKEIEELKK